MGDNRGRCAMARAGLDSIGVDAIHVEEDLHVRESVDSRKGLGSEALRQLDEHALAISIVVDDVARELRTTPTGSSEMAISSKCTPGNGGQGFATANDASRPRRLDAHTNHRADAATRRPGMLKPSPWVSVPTSRSRPRSTATRRQRRARGRCRASPSGSRSRTRDTRCCRAGRDRGLRPRLRSRRAAG